MKHRIRLAAGMILGTVCLTAAIPAAYAAHAATVQQPIGIRGDLDGDHRISLTDIRELADWLTASPDLIPAEKTDFADMDGNGILNSADLTLMKRAAIQGYSPEILYTEVEEALMTAPVSEINPTLASTGTNHLLMFVVDFPDCKFKQNYSADQIREISFGPANPNSNAYPLESVIGYYQRASFGALNMEADIYFYSAQNSISVYTNHSEILVDEIMAAFDDRLDYSRYDVNGDRIMDTILLSVADNAPEDGWWPCSGYYAGTSRFDGIQPGNVILGNTSPSKTEEYNNTWIHELGHAMGLPDYYCYDNTDDGLYGLNGPAGFEMMDDAFGDMSAFSKLMLGWYTPSQVQVYTGGVQTYLLESSQNENGANCVIIPRYGTDGFLSEYMLIEYVTHTGNNATEWLFDYGGIRILHCDAEITYDSYWGPELKWNNYGIYYDSTNKKQRVLRLSNEQEGGYFYTAGQTVNSSVSGFRWYDISGYQTVDTGVTVTVGAQQDGKCTVTISQ